MACEGMCGSLLVDCLRVPVVGRFVCVGGRGGQIHRFPGYAQ